MKELIKKLVEKRKAAKAKKKEPETLKDTVISWVKTLVGAIVFVMIINGLLVASFVVPTGSMEKTVMTGDFLFVNKLIFGPSTPQIIPFLNIPLPFYRFPGLRDPQKGDVIVFIFPGYRDEVEASEFQYYLKRCVATAGDSLEVKNNILFINGKEQKMAPDAVYDPNLPRDPMESFRTFPKGRGFTHDNFGPVRVPKKGDVIQLLPENFQEWETFVQREGHEVSFTTDKFYIDGVPATKYKVTKDYCFGMGDNRDHSLDSRFWGFIPYENVLGKPIIAYWSWPMTDEFDRPMTFFQKIANIRWSRIGRLID